MSKFIAKRVVLHFFIVIVALVNVTDGFVLMPNGAVNRYKRESAVTEIPFPDSTVVHNSQETSTADAYPSVAPDSTSIPPMPKENSPGNTESSVDQHSSTPYPETANTTDVTNSASNNSKNISDSWTPAALPFLDLTETNMNDSILSNVTDNEKGVTSFNQSDYADIMNITGAALTDMYQVMMAARANSTIVVPTATRGRITKSRVPFPSEPLVTSTIQPMFSMTETEILIRKLATDILIRLLEKYGLKASTMNGPPAVTDVIGALKASRQQALPPPSPSQSQLSPQSQSSPWLQPYPASQASNVRIYPSYFMWRMAENRRRDRKAARNGIMPGRSMRGSDEDWEELTGYERESGWNMSMFG